MAALEIARRDRRWHPQPGCADDLLRCWRRETGRRKFAGAGVAAQLGRQEIPSSRGIPHVGHEQVNRFATASRSASSPSAAAHPIAAVFQHTAQKRSRGDRICPQMSTVCRRLRTSRTLRRPRSRRNQRLGRQHKQRRSAGHNRHRR